MVNPNSNPNPNPNPNSNPNPSLPGDGAVHTRLLEGCAAIKQAQILATAGDGLRCDVCCKPYAPVRYMLSLSTNIMLTPCTGFVHRDLKSLNFFVTDLGDSLSVVRLGDFGETVSIAAAAQEEPRQHGSLIW